MKINFNVLTTALCILLFCSTSHAQYGSMIAGLSATGSESVSLQPEGLRLVMRIQGVGKDGKSAIKALNEQKELVKKELTGMNATADSIRFSASEVKSGVGSDNEVRMFRSMRMGGGPAAIGEEAEDEPAIPKVFSANCWVQAKWALPAKEGDAIALLPAMLRQQISARDLEGKKRKPDLDAEQLEQYEQMAQMMEQQMSYGSSDVPAVRVEYFAKVPQDVIKKATAKAFDRAKKQAEVLSAAAGTQLGKVHTVMTDPRDSMREMYQSWGGPGVQGVQVWLKNEDDVEYATSLDSLEYSVSVWLGYALE